MKKLLTFGLILATILSVGLTSCINSPDALPGTWTTTGELYQISSAKPFTTGSLTTSGQTAVYELKQPSGVADDDKPDEGYYSSSIYCLTKENIYTGFKATVDSNANGGSGFVFCQSSNGDLWSYYYLYINSSGSIRVNEVIDDKSKTIIDWTKNDAIKPVGQKNEVLVYTDASGNIQIKINGTAVTYIKEPVLKSGRIGVVCTLGYKDVQTDNSIKVTYNFTNFQY